MEPTFGHLRGRDDDLVLPISICPSGLSVITQCCIHELYLKGKSHQPVTDLAKSFERRKCNHKEAIPGNDCILTVIGGSLLIPSPRIRNPWRNLKYGHYLSGETNKHRYVIATQSHPLRVGLRAIPGAPIVHINRSVMVLEPASDVTLQSKQRVRCAIGCLVTLSYTHIHWNPCRPSKMRSGRPYQKRLC